MKKILLECIAVCVFGAALGLAANALSPKSITLGRNYFPAPVVSKGTHLPPNVAPATSTNALPGTNTAMGTNNATSQATAIQARLQSAGLTGITTEEAHQLWSDPRRQAGLIVFIDARDDTHYKEGHIPGAYQLDYYRPESYLPAVLPAVTAAETVVVYCNGGDCEDSELTAVFLKNAGVPVSKLRVETGGYTEWHAQRLPVEMGQQNSGQMLQAQP